MSSAPETPDALARKLAGNLDRQVALYEDVKEMSVRQQELIERGDTAGLMALLSEKQKRIAEIDALAREAGPLREAWEAGRDALAEDARAPVERAVERLRELLEAIVALEDAGQGSLGQARDAAGGSIAKLQKGKALHKAYGGGKKPPPGARFQDRSG